MSLLDGKFHEATKSICNAPWGGHKKNFRCYLCGHKFQIGDKFKMLFTNDLPAYGGNPLVCESCDGDDVIDRWKARCDEWRSIIKDKFWIFVKWEGDKG